MEPFVSHDSVLVLFWLPYANPSLPMQSVCFTWFCAWIFLAVLCERRRKLQFKQNYASLHATPHAKL